MNLIGFVKGKSECECRQKGRYVIVFERPVEQTINFANTRRVRLEIWTGCKIWLRRQMLEEVTNFSSVFHKHASIEGERKREQ